MKTFRNLSILFALVAIPAIALAGAGKGDKEARKAERAEMKAKYDANGDGELSDAERAKMHDAMISARFDRLDANGDGMISRAEFTAHAKEHKGKRWGKQGGKKHKGAKPAR